jgi:hypothetical protein
MSISFRGLNRLGKMALAAVTGRTNVHFLHIRKTGGTTIKHVLIDHQVLARHVLHLHPHRVRLADIPRGHKVMFVVRDPVTRFVSGFGSRLRQGAPAHHVPWTADEARAFAQFKDPESLALALDATHPDHAAALHAMASITHIRASYWDWFSNEALLAEREDQIFFIGRIETFAADFAALKPALALPDSLVLPEDAKSTNRSAGVPGTSSRLGEEAVRQIHAWYQRDYDFLAFCDRWRQRHGGAVASGQSPGVPG